MSSKEVPKLIPTLQLEAEELEQVANMSKLTLQSETTEKMKQLVVSAENSEENPTKKHPNIITKDETNVQGEAPQNSGDVISQLKLYVYLPIIQRQYQYRLLMSKAQFYWSHQSHWTNHYKLKKVC